MESKEFIKNIAIDVGSAAMLLVLTKNIFDEDTIKTYLQEDGYKIAVTELGGRSSYVDFQEKTTRSVIGACLNCGIIKKEQHEIHAVLHAAEEAKKGIIVNVSTNASLSIKIAIVRKDSWIAVGVFGNSAIYHATNHQRAGLGVMHI